ncbi:MAG: flagellar assembly protein FliH [Pseudomonadota bacterium]
MSDDAVAADRWQAPQFPDNGPMLTAGELEAVQKEAYDEAYAEAFAKGLEEGRAQGLREAAGEISQQHALLKDALHHLASPLAELDDTLELQLATMVTVMVGRLFRRELVMDPDSIIGLVREAVQLLPIAARNIEVHVHPDDADRLATIAAAAGDSDTLAAQRWSIVADASLSRGGCMVKTDSAQIDARVESRIEQMINDLVGDQRA